MGVRKESGKKNSAGRSNAAKAKGSDGSNKQQEAVSCRQLSSELLEDPKKANNCVKLIASLNADTQEVELRHAIRGLKLYFVSAFDKHGLRSSNKVDPKADVFGSWLQRQYISCLRAMLELMTDPATPSAAQVEALMAMMEFMRGEELGTFRNDLFTTLMTSVLRSAAFSDIFLGAFSNKFLQFADVRFYTLQSVRKVANSLSGNSKTAEDEDDDVEDDGDDAAEVDGTLASASGRQQLSPPDVARNCFDLLSAIPESASPNTAPKNLSRKEQLLMKALQGGEGGGSGNGASDASTKLLSWCGASERNLVQAAPGKSESAAKRRKRKRDEAAGAGGQGDGKQEAPAAAAPAKQWANLKLQKKAYSSAWLSFLRMALPEDIYKKVLSKVHTTVLPNMADPILLADFLTASLNKGGLVAVLALNGIFILVTKHGLEYPNFYRRLYSLLQPEVFRAKHRVEFFGLVDRFLSSALVPAYTVAAFAKRFARLALTSTPAGAMVALGFIHNLIRRHPSCIVLLHRPAKEGTEATGSGEDVYLEDCEDPAESRGIESSLWEIDTLKSHYSADVAQMATLLLEKDITDRRKTAEINMAQLTKASYSSMVQAELKKRLKKVPVAFYAQAPTKLFDTHCEADFVGWSFDD